METVTPRRGFLPDNDDDDENQLQLQHPTNPEVRAQNHYHGACRLSQLSKQ